MKMYNINSKEINWTDFCQSIEIKAPTEFNFYECMVYLNRSAFECLHKVKDNALYKMLKYKEAYIITKIEFINKNIRVTFLNMIPERDIKAQIAEYIWHMFDFGTDLSIFYEKARGDKILNLLVNKYRGLRIVKINDFFEGVCWAIIGQQINLKFAYTLKKRLVEKYGECLEYEGENYFTFPTPDKIAQLDVEDLKNLKFNQRKAEYITDIAQLFLSGIISKEKLMLESSYEDIHKRLVSIRGIGNWTADYVIMKCFNANCAFPIADVGIHNALKSILALSEKPSISEIENLAQNWRGWEAYATFYIWRWLYD